MSIPQRHASSPGTYFVTSRTWEGRALFQKKENADLFVSTLLHYRDEGAFLLHSFVAMPNHTHILLTPGPETSLERAVQYIKGGFAKRFNDEQGRRFPVWQRGFSDHRIRDEDDYKIHVAYMEQNPVKKRLVTSAGDYQWSSASGRFKLDPWSGCDKAVPERRVADGRVR